MIVDDNKSFRVALRHILERTNNHEVICEAENGKQALDLVKIFRPDLILLDIEMPEMNGIITAKKMLWENKEKRT